MRSTVTKRRNPPFPWVTPPAKVRLARSTPTRMRCPLSPVTKKKRATISPIPLRILVSVRRKKAVTTSIRRATTAMAGARRSIQAMARRRKRIRQRNLRTAKRCLPLRRRKRMTLSLRRNRLTARRRRKNGTFRIRITQRFRRVLQPVKPAKICRKRLSTESGTAT